MPASLAANRAANRSTRLAFDWQYRISSSVKTRWTKRSPKRSMAVAMINQLSIHHARFGGQLVSPYRPGGVDVQHLVAVGYQVVGDQQAVTAEIDSFGAHVSSTRVFGELDQFSRGVLELAGQRVVGVIAKAEAAQAYIGGIVADLLAAATEGFHPDILNVCRWKRLLKVFAIEIGRPA